MELIKLEWDKQRYPYGIFPSDYDLYDVADDDTRTMLFYTDANSMTTDGVFEATDTILFCVDNSKTREMLELACEAWCVEVDLLDQA